MDIMFFFLCGEIQRFAKESNCIFPTSTEEEAGQNHLQNEPFTNAEAVKTTGRITLFWHVPQNFQTTQIKPAG